MSHWVWGLVRELAQPADEDGRLKWQMTRALAAVRERHGVGVELRELGAVAREYLAALRTRWSPIVINLDDPRNADLKAAFENPESPVEPLSPKEHEAFLRWLETGEVDPVIAHLVQGTERRPS